MLADESAGDVKGLPSRYRVHEQLGRGGMARVFRVTDELSGRDVALKQMLAPTGVVERETVDALFEREYHVLSQLSHPRVIAVYDYGRDDSGVPYYTMELLDGGDLRDRAPVPWREACRLLFDVCSSLALLHSRRLIHRDLSPRNVRCTRAGAAKLIDFGAMVPMGAGGGAIVGTPAFTAPETVHRSALDGRTDLFALGATLYYAISGQLAYPARSFAEVLSAWNQKPVPLSARVPEVPVALDELVLSLLHIEPSLRPKSSFEVMQRLAAIAGLEVTEVEGVARAYLTAPMLIGREQIVERLRSEVRLAREGWGGGLMLRGEPGSGRSRVLDACALEAETLGVTALRAAASGEEPFRVAFDLVQHSIEAGVDQLHAAEFPQLFEPVAAEQASAAGRRFRLRPAAELLAEPDLLRQSIARYLLAVSRAQPLVVAVDDVERIDEPSAAVLATLVDKARRGHVLLALTAPSDTRSSRALSALARRCDEQTLAPLDRDQTLALVTSLFGEVANLDPVADEIHRLSNGIPRACMDLAQYLVDRRMITYAAGVWTLPAKLPANALPKTTEDAMRARLDALSPDAQLLARAQALAFHETFMRADYRRLLPQLPPAELATVLSELLATQLITTQGSSYGFAHHAWKEVVTADLDDAERRVLHAALAHNYDGRSANGNIHHLFAAGLDEQGLDMLLKRDAEYADNYDYRTVLEANAAGMGPTYLRALAAATRLGRPARERNELLRWFTAMSASSDVGYYWQAAPSWLVQLEHDSGLSLYRADRESPDPGQRLMRALQTAYERHQAAPEPERVYAVDEALRLLAEYVVFSIAVGARSRDSALLATLPPLLEPFAPLSPLLDAIWQNALATLDCTRDARYEQARARYLAVLEKLAGVTSTEAKHVDQIRNAIVCAIGMAEATFGMPSAADWAAQLEHDPAQRVSAIYLQKLVRFEQGDWAGADKLRRQAEIFSLQARVPPMFEITLLAEVNVHAAALDLAGLKHVIERLEQLSAEFPNWRPHLFDAQARFRLLSGDAAAAKTLFERALESTAPDAHDVSVNMAIWLDASSGLVDTLLALQDAREARRVGAAAYAVAERHTAGACAFELARQLALAEAALGDYEPAIQRVDAIIARQRELGTSGLRLGMSYEARARIAIWRADHTLFHECSRLAAAEYGYAKRSPLGVRYERLLGEAQRRGVARIEALAPLDQETQIEGADSGADVQSMVMSAMFSAQGTEERARAALRLALGARAATGGHLYLARAGGLALVASAGPLPAPEVLERLASEYVERDRDRAETLTVVATGTVVEGGDLVEPTVEAAGVGYELRLLSCVFGGVGRVAGVIAVEQGDSHEQHVRGHHGQLLAALAAHFLQAGDCA